MCLKIIHTISVINIIKILDQFALAALEIRFRVVAGRNSTVTRLQAGKQGFGSRQGKVLLFTTK